MNNKLKQLLLIALLFLLFGCFFSAIQNSQYATDIFSKKQKSVFDFEEAFVLALFLKSDDVLDYADPKLHKKITEWFEQTKVNNCYSQRGSFEYLLDRNDYQTVQFSCGGYRLKVKGLTSEKTKYGYKVVNLHKIEYDKIELAP